MTTRASSARLAGLGLLCALASGCGLGAEPPNVLLVVVDTLRRDHLGAYGYERSTSPNLDALAADAVRYDAAQSQAPWTLPSAAAILSGRYPGPLGIVCDENVLPEELVLLSEVLGQRGYATGAVVSHKFVSSRWGFDQGFDLFDDSEAKGHMTVSSPAVIDAALAFLEENRDGPFFLFVHLFDPHFAYLEHAGFVFPEGDYTGPITNGIRFKALMEMQAAGEITSEDARELVRFYDSELAFTDHQIGRLLDGLRALGVYDETLVIATADHGEEFLDHGRIGHGKTLYEELVGVPLIVRFPGGEPGVVADPVGLIDLFPTVLELVDASTENLDGFSLLARPDARVVFASTERRGGFRAARDARFKLIRPLLGPAEFYDLAADPGETKNLLGSDGSVPAEHAADFARVLAAMEPYREQLSKVPRRLRKLELTPQEIQSLRSLGYLDGWEE